MVTPSQDSLSPEVKGLREFTLTLTFAPKNMVCHSGQIAKNICHVFLILQTAKYTRDNSNETRSN